MDKTEDTKASQEQDTGSRSRSSSIGSLTSVERQLIGEVYPSSPPKQSGTVSTPLPNDSSTSTNIPSTQTSTTTGPSQSLHNLSAASASYAHNFKIPGLTIPEPGQPFEEQYTTDSPPAVPFSSTGPSQPFKENANDAFDNGASEEELKAEQERKMQTRNVLKPRPRSSKGKAVANAPSSSDMTPATSHPATSSDPTSTALPFLATAPPMTATLAPETANFNSATTSLAPAASTLPPATTTFASAAPDLLFSVPAPTLASKPTTFNFGETPDGKGAIFFGGASGKDKKTFSAISSRALEAEQTQKLISRLQKDLEEALIAGDREAVRREESEGKASTELADAKSNYTNLERQYEKIKRGEDGHLSRISNLEEANQKLQQAADNAQERAVAAKRQIGETTTELNQAKQCFVSWEEEMDTLQKQNSSLRTQLDNAKEREKQQQSGVQELERRAELADASSRNYPVKVARLNKEISELKTEANNAESRASKLEGEVKQLTVEKIKAESELTSIQAQISYSEANENRLRDRVSRIETENTALQTNIESLRVSLRRKDQQSEGLHLEITGLTDNLNNANEELAKYKDHHAAFINAEAKEPITPREPKEPINPPPSFSGDDEWSKRMGEFAEGKKMPELEKEEEDSKEIVVGKQQATLAHSEVVTVIDVPPTAPSHPLEVLSTSGVITVVNVKPTAPSYPPQILTLSVHAAVLPDISTVISLPKFNSLLIFVCLLFTWLSWTFITGRLERSQWVAANHATRRLW